MALVVFLRGCNVGGHRSFRPTILARRLNDYAVTNIGATGTFIVRRPGSRTKFLAALRRKLPFEAIIAVCDGTDLIRLQKEHPFGNEPPPMGVVRFVSILSQPARANPRLPLNLPTTGDWLVRIVASDGRFIFGEYRRHMRTIGYLGQIDRLFGSPVTTRNWNTIVAIANDLTARLS